MILCQICSIEEIFKNNMNITFLMQLLIGIIFYHCFLQNLQANYILKCNLDSQPCFCTQISLVLLQ